MSALLQHLIVASLLATGCASAQERSPCPAPGALYAPRGLPVFHGRIDLFTLTPRSDVDGFVMTDGTEVKTPPHLTSQVLSTFKPGDAVTVRGLKAASLALVQALSVTNDADGRSVVDLGPECSGHPPPRPDMAPEPPGQAVSLTGRIRMLLHGPRGDVNGVLLEDRTILKLPPPEAARLAALLAPGRSVAAEGVRRSTAPGSVVDLTAIGPDGGSLARVGRDPRPAAAVGRRPPV